MRRQVLRLRATYSGVKADGRTLCVAAAVAPTFAPAEIVEPGESRESQAERSCPVSIGRYRVRKLLKHSGQADVYLAEHPTLDVEVVVKWGHEAVSEGSADVVRIAEEARVLAGLAHPHLAKIHDYGIEAGRPFLVLEYIAGEDLTCALANRTFRPDDAARLMARIARAVAHAHAHGILHLDLKPSNIMLETGQRPKLIDFGAALPRIPSSRRPMACMSRVGTPEYMAPEQLAADADQISERTDVYGLGAVLYELLTGHPPAPEELWDDQGTRRSQRGAARSRHTRWKSGLHRICERALHPDPDQRFATAEEFAEALERFASVRMRCRRAALATLLLAANVCLAIWPTQFMPASAPSLLAMRTSAHERLPRLVPLDSGLRVRGHVPAGTKAACYVQLSHQAPMQIRPLQRTALDHCDVIIGLEGRRLEIASNGMASLLVLCTHDSDQAAARQCTWPARPLPRIPPELNVRFDQASIEITPEAAWRSLPAETAIPLLEQIKSLQADLSQLASSFDAVLLPGTVSL